MKFKEYIEQTKKKKSQKKKDDKSIPIMFASIGKRKQLKENTEKQIDALHKKLSAHYVYDPHHIKEIESYTSSSRYINHHLYENEKKRLGMEHDKDETTAKSKAWAHPKLQRMYDAMTKHKTPKDIHVFTGLSTDPRKHFDPSETHTTVRMPAYTSTSLDHGIAENFVKRHSDNVQHIMRIKIPKGSHGAYVEHHTDAPGEHEFILHHGAHLKISNKPFKVVKDGSFGYTHYHDAELIHDGTTN